MQSEILIVSGYSFGDKGINTRLVDYINDPICKKFILIHPDKSVLIKQEVVSI